MFYKLKVTGDDEYMAFTQSPYNLKEVMTKLTRELRHLMPNWINIKKEGLTPKTRMLNQWLSTRLMLATSHSVTAKKRALLLYAISKGFSINVGRVINTEMKAMTNPMKKTRAIEFHSLITTLCSIAGLSYISDLA